MKIKLRNFIFIFLFIILIFSIAVFSVGCQKRQATSEDLFIIEEDEENSDQFVIIDFDETNEKVDWNNEKEKLKGIGKVSDVRVYCSISAIVSIEQRYIEEQASEKGWSTEDKNNRLLAKKNELFNYFSVDQKMMDEFYEAHKIEIENYILGHPDYQKAIESIE